MREAQLLTPSLPLPLSPLSPPSLLSLLPFAATPSKAGNHSAEERAAPPTPLDRLLPPSLATGTRARIHTAPPTASFLSRREEKSARPKLQKSNGLFRARRAFPRLAQPHTRRRRDLADEPALAGDHDWCRRSHKLDLCTERRRSSCAKRGPSTARHLPPWLREPARAVAGSHTSPLGLSGCPRANPLQSIALRQRRRPIGGAARKRASERAEQNAAAPHPPSSSFRDRETAAVDNEARTKGARAALALAGHGP